MTELNTTQVAEKLETTTRTLRKFLRADARSQGKGDTLPGKGSRYSIPARDVQGLKKRFKVWSAAEAQARKERAEKAAAEAQVEADEVDEVDDSEE